MQEVGSRTRDKGRKSSGAFTTYLRGSTGRNVWYLGQKCHVAVTQHFQMKDGNVSVEGTDLALQFEM